MVCRRLAAGGKSNGETRSGTSTTGEGKVRRGVADAWVTCCRVPRWSPRDLCAPSPHISHIWKLLPRNPDPRPRRAAAACARTRLVDLTEYFKSYRSRRASPRSRISMRRARDEKFFCSLIIAGTYCISRRIARYFTRRAGALL